MLSLSYIQEKSSQSGRLQTKNDKNFKGTLLQYAYNMRLGKLFNFAMMDYYNGGFLTAGDWLRVIILHHLIRQVHGLKSYITLGKWLMFQLWFSEAFARNKLRFAYVYEIGQLKFLSHGLTSIVCLGDLQTWVPIYFISSNSRWNSHFLDEQVETLYSLNLNKPTWKDVKGGSYLVKNVDIAWPRFIK